MSLSFNTQAILLLTAPLIIKRRTPVDLLSLGEYNKLARFLHERQREPADLLATNDDELLMECKQIINPDRLKSLLSRGFLLSQVVQHWQDRSIWVVSRADNDYPERLKTRLKDSAPPIIYGCGESASLDIGGLAIVGSRDVDDNLIVYTKGIGHLTAEAGHAIISGGARGIDQAAMRGALEAGGRVVGVLSENLERTALNRENRNLIMEGQLILTSPFDPSAGFNAGHAMQRNKLIYAFADVALVVNSDYQRGGTWTGAVEQLDKLRFVPVYIRSDGEPRKGLDALRRKGALPWPNPETPEALAEVLTTEVVSTSLVALQNTLFPSIQEESKHITESPQTTLPDTSDILKLPTAPEDELSTKIVESLTATKKVAKTVAELASILQVASSQLKKQLQQLVEEGVLEKLTRPVKYMIKSQRSMFE